MFVFGNRRSGRYRRLYAVFVLIALFALTGCAMRAEDAGESGSGVPTAPENTDIDKILSQYGVNTDKKAGNVQNNGEGNGSLTEGDNGDSSGNEQAGSLYGQLDGTSGNAGSDTQPGTVSEEGTPDTVSGSENTDPESNPANAETEVEEKPHYVVVFDPGHGGRWYGACYIGLYEKDLTLKVANYARDYLLENYDNIDVYLTREDDDPLDKDLKTDLTKRCDLAVEVGATCLVSIHFNATDAHTLSGTEVWCSRRSNVHDQTFELGELIMKEFVALGLQRRDVTSRKSNDTFDENGRAMDYYAINRYCAARNIPGIIVEQCFMDSEHDQQYITSEEGLKSLGEANAKGVAAYFDVLTERAKAAREEAESGSGESSGGSGENSTGSGENNQQ